MAEPEIMNGTVYHTNVVYTENAEVCDKPSSPSYTGVLYTSEKSQKTGSNWWKQRRWENIETIEECIDHLQIKNSKYSNCESSSGVDTRVDWVFFKRTIHH
jgi:hypothetical protein